MTSKFVEIGPGQNLPPTIKEADQDDNLFIANARKLMQWSVSQGQGTDYGDIMASDITSMAQTSDKNYLFISDSEGFQTQLDFKRQKVVRDYGNIHESTNSIAITSDGKFLQTSGQEKNGHVKQFSVRDAQMIKDFGQIFVDGVRTITTTPDNKWLFAASDQGHLQQISLESQQVVHDYEKLSGDAISCLKTTRDSKWLITGSYHANVRRISVENREVHKDLGKHSYDPITAMKITADGEELFIGDYEGLLKLISLTDGKLIKYFGQVHQGEITGIMTPANQKFFFTSSYGTLKKWDY